ncbi:MAG: hypothetical protein RL557_934 [archaeon]|jgi:hypothetical protein
MVAILSELFGGRMRTKVGFPPNGWKYCDIPRDDAINMNLVYSRRLSVNRHITPRDFLINVSERLQIEWSLNEGRNKQSSDYRGEGFTDFIRDETHYELERAGYTWHTEAGCFRRLTADTYTLTRKSVLAGFVRHAVEFFEKNDAAWEKFLSTDEYSSS